jgi:acetyl-CoA C-acetyltransferase
VKFSENSKKRGVKRLPNFIMDRVIIESIGFTKVADHWEKSLVDLAVESSSKALARSTKEPDAVIVSNMFSALSSRQENLGPLISAALGFSRKTAIKVENAGASGAAAVLLGSTLIRSGEANSVLVVGVEKMRDLEPSEANLAVSMAESAEYTQYLGVPLVAMAAMLARSYMHEFSVTREMLSSLSVLAHRNAVTAAHAQFRKAITVEDVVRSATVSDPLKILDCAPTGDGSAAVILTRSDNRKGDIEIAGSGMATQEFSIYERENMLDFAATREATRFATEKSGLDLSDIDIFEICDSYSIVGAMSLEGIGLSRVGEGAKEALAGRFDLVGGEVPINTFGGLKGRGHPIGATGVYQICEAYMQLAGLAGSNSVKQPKAALTHCCSGLDTSAVVHIIRKM